MGRDCREKRGSGRPWFNTPDGGVIFEILKSKKNYHDSNIKYDERDGVFLRFAETSLMLQFALTMPYLYLPGKHILHVPHVVLVLMSCPSMPRCLHLILRELRWVRIPIMIARRRRS